MGRRGVADPSILPEKKGPTPQKAASNLTDDDDDDDKKKNI